MSTLFDPLGLASPVTIKMRMTMQEIWRNKELGWDDKLTIEDSQMWSSLFEEMFCLNTISFPRSIKPIDAIGQSELHAFCDASLKAYGAVVYIVWLTSNGTRQLQLITSKARVAPLRQSTVPRLELMAALVGSRLVMTVLDELRVKPGHVFIWSDSHVVLHWLRSESINMKPFIGVRVTEIQSTWEASCFRFVPTELNPADDLSRGITVDRMSGRWMSGPEFLTRHKSEWPVEPTTSVSDESVIKKIKPLFAMIKSFNPVIYPERFSSYSRLLRATAYCSRFVENLKLSVQTACGQHPDGQSLNGPLTLNEINRAENYWIQAIQNSFVNWEDNFRDLCPYVENQIIRVGGRLRHIELTYDQRHPVLLPKDHHITTLIIRDFHQKVGHAGAERTLASIRRKFKKVVKKIVRSCVICRKLRQPACETIMADLPPERLKPLSPPFTTTGVDLFGPFMLKYVRNKSIKTWGAIFTCGTTRVVHLEIVQDLSTPSFLLALRRFDCHHGWPGTIISDNGSNFVGAQKELAELFKQGRKQIEDFAVVHKVVWKFITPLSPHQGGFYESLIKQVKKNLQVLIGQQVLSWNEMSTVFAEVENLVNSRPLRYLPDDPNDPQPLTPNHFILGCATTEIPSGPFEETKNLRKRFLFVQSLISQFLKRFLQEYIPTLMRRSKWLSKKRQVQLDDIVLLVDNSCVRGIWNLARVVEVYHFIHTLFQIPSISERASCEIVFHWLAIV